MCSSNLELGRGHVERLAETDANVARWLADVTARLARAAADRQRADEFAWLLTAPTASPVADVQ